MELFCFHVQNELSNSGIQNIPNESQIYPLFHVYDQLIATNYL